MMVSALPFAWDAIYFSHCPLDDYLGAYNYSIQEQLMDWHCLNSESIQELLFRRRFWSDFCKFWSDFCKSYKEEE